MKVALKWLFVLFVGWLFFAVVCHSFVWGTFLLGQTDEKNVQILAFKATGALLIIGACWTIFWSLAAFINSINQD